MVRRLPVLQSSPPADAPLAVVSAVMLAVPAVVLAWAVLLWFLSRFGYWGVGVAYVAASALGAGALGHRVVAARRLRFAVAAAPVTAVSVWSVALASGVLEGIGIALAALGALLGLGATGFGLGLLGLFWRQRVARSPRH